MYNTNIICTYNTDNILNVMEIDEEDDFIRDAVYSHELLNIFCLENYDDSININIEKLYDRIKDNIELNNCMIKLANKYMCEDKLFGLTIMYSFDYMYLTHLCVSEFLNKGFISEHNIKNLNKLIM